MKHWAGGSVNDKGVNWGKEEGFDLGHGWALWSSHMGTWRGWCSGERNLDKGEVSGRADAGHTPQPTAKALLIREARDASSPRILPVEAVTAPQVPPLMELMLQAGCEWQSPSSHTFLGSGLPHA